MHLIQSLDMPQRKTAIVDPTAFKDILTAASRKAALQRQPSGLSGLRMSEKQFDLLMALTQEYARNLPASLVKRREEQIRSAGKNIYFAWSGGIHRDEPHYYRIQTPSFIIEFDNPQDAANHIHSVWRDLSGDFGADLLKVHYHTSHPLKSAPNSLDSAAYGDRKRFAGSQE
jgi:hypothetical protein